MVNILKSRLFFWWIPGLPGLCSAANILSESKALCTVLRNEGFSTLAAYPIPNKTDLDANRQEYQNSYFRYSPFTTAGRCRRRLAKLIIKELESRSE